MFLHRLMVAGGALLLTVRGLADEAWDFCYEDDGAICKISSELQQECRNVEGKKFKQCNCESGFLRAQQACGYCRAAIGELTFPSLIEQQIEECKESGYSVAPLPASYVSEIRERNKTATLPKITTTSSSSSTSRSGTLFTTPLVAPAKGTVTGMPTVTLPTLIPPTAPAESMADKIRTMESQSIKCLFMTAFIVYVLFTV